MSPVYYLQAICVGAHLQITTHFQKCLYEMKSHTEAVLVIL